MVAQSLLNHHSNSNCTMPKLQLELFFDHQNANTICFTRSTARLTYSNYTTYMYITLGPQQDLHTATILHTCTSHQAHSKIYIQQLYNIHVHHTRPTARLTYSNYTTYMYITLGPQQDLHTATIQHTCTSHQAHSKTYIQQLYNIHVHHTRPTARLTYINYTTYMYITLGPQQDLHTSTIQHTCTSHQANSLHTATITIQHTCTSHQAHSKTYIQQLQHIQQLYNIHVHHTTIQHTCTSHQAHSKTYIQQLYNIHVHHTRPTARLTYINYTTYMYITLGPQQDLHTATIQHTCTSHQAHSKTYIQQLYNIHVHHTRPTARLTYSNYTTYMYITLGPQQDLHTATIQHTCTSQQAHSKTYIQQLYNIHVHHTRPTARLTYSNYTTYMYITLGPQQDLHTATIQQLHTCTSHQAHSKTYILQLYNIHVHHTRPTARLTYSNYTTYMYITLGPQQDLHTATIQHTCTSHQAHSKTYIQQLYNIHVHHTRPTARLTYSNYTTYMYITLGPQQDLHTATIQHTCTSHQAHSKTYIHQLYNIHVHHTRPTARLTYSNYTTYMYITLGPQQDLHTATIQHTCTSHQAHSKTYIQQLYNIHVHHTRPTARLTYSNYTTYMYITLGPQQDLHTATIQHTCTSHQAHSKTYIQQLYNIHVHHTRPTARLTYSNYTTYMYITLGPQQDLHTATIQHTCTSHQAHSKTYIQQLYNIHVHHTRPTARLTYSNYTTYMYITLGPQQDLHTATIQHTCTSHQAHSKTYIQQLYNIHVHHTRPTARLTYSNYTTYMYITLGPQQDLHTATIQHTCTSHQAHSKTYIQQLYNIHVHHTRPTARLTYSNYTTYMYITLGPQQDLHTATIQHTCTSHQAHSKTYIQQLYNIHVHHTRPTARLTYSNYTTYMYITLGPQQDLHTATIQHTCTSHQAHSKTYIQQLYNIHVHHTRPTARLTYSNYTTYMYITLGPQQDLHTATIQHTCTSHQAHSKTYIQQLYNIHVHHTRPTARLTYSNYTTYMYITLGPQQDLHTATIQHTCTSHQAHSKTYIQQLYNIHVHHTRPTARLTYSNYTTYMYITLGPQQDLHTATIQHTCTSHQAHSKTYIHQLYNIHVHHTRPTARLTYSNYTTYMYITLGPQQDLHTATIQHTCTSHQAHSKTYILQLYNIHVHHTRPTARLTYSNYTTYMYITLGPQQDLHTATIQQHKIQPWAPPFQE